MDTQRFEVVGEPQVEYEPGLSVPSQITIFVVKGTLPPPKPVRRLVWSAVVLWVAVMAAVSLIVWAVIR